MKPRRVPWQFYGSFHIEFHGVPMEFSCVFAHVKLPWEKFFMEISWNVFHEMFSIAIPWSIKLGHLQCRIAVIQVVHNTDSHCVPMLYRFIDSQIVVENGKFYLRISQL